MKKRANDVPTGTLRIDSKELKVYEKNSSGWKISEKILPNAIKVAKLFKSHGRLEDIKDTNNPGFLKGQLSPKCKPQGARINIIPDGKEVDKAFSLFAPHLTVHDESSNSNWDVIYRNPNGDYSYVYTLDKKDKAIKKKYEEVKDFEKLYSRAKRKAIQKVKSKCEVLDLAVYTLLRTFMRVGNEIYYKSHGHKGLTTIQKKDISINENKVEFDYKGKDGTPLKIKKTFPETYVNNLKQRLEKINKERFVFANSNGNPLRDSDFKKWFKENIGKEFYPHIVRSYYATSKVEDFLKKNKNPSKEDVNKLFYEIAETLGHKKFSKKDEEWEVNTKTTINHYIDPELVKKIEREPK